MWIVCSSSFVCCWLYGALICIWDMYAFRQDWRAAHERQGERFDEETNTLFGVLWRKPDHTMDDLPAHPVMKKWWAYMADIMETHADNKPVAVVLPPVFYMP